MVWTAIPNSDIDADSPLTTGLLTALRDNVASAFAKDSGAPVLANNYVTDTMIATDTILAGSIAAGAVGQSEIGASAVGSGELKTTTATLSGQTAWLTTTAGAYAFSLLLKTNSSGSALWQASNVGSLATVAYTTSTSYSKQYYVYNYSSGSMSIQERYVQSSPPYNLGDGDVPLFVYILVDSFGSVEAASVAPEATWHNNGFTDIRATRKDNVSGRSWKEVPEIIADLNDANLTRQEAVRLGIHTREEIADRLIADSKVDMEITQAVKQADMPLIPHPFQYCNLRNKTIVMLDPVSPTTEKLLMLHNEGEDINKLLHNNKIPFGNTALDRVMPEGVMAVDFTL